MKRTAILLLALLPLLSAAQVKIPKGANRFTYHQIEYGEHNDTTAITVLREGDVVTIVTPQPEGKLIPGYAQTVTEVDYAQDSITVSAYYDDSVYYYRTPFSRSDLEWRRDGNRNPITEYQIEGYDMFDEMVHLIREDTVRRMYMARINVPQE